MNQDDCLGSTDIGVIEHEILKVMKLDQPTELSYILKETELETNEVNYYMRKLISAGLVVKPFRGLYVRRATGSSGGGRE